MLFLADVDHANCAKIKVTRRYPPTGRRAGCLALSSSKISDRQKDTAALIIKTAEGKYLSVWNCLPSSGFFLFCRWAD